MGIRSSATMGRICRADQQPIPWAASMWRDSEVEGPLRCRRSASRRTTVQSLMPWVGSMEVCRSSWAPATNASLKSSLAAIAFLSCWMAGGVSLRRTWIAVWLSDEPG